MSTTIPQVTAHPRKSAPTSVGTSPPENDLRILVVEDDDLVRIMLRLGLERYGFRVTLATDGPDAIEQYQKNASEIDVVLLDVCMSGLDGPRTLDALRLLNPDVVACFVSGHTGIYEHKELLRRGARYVFAKPFLLEDLAKKLRAIVETSSTAC